jgi:hypothetical protein
MVKPTTPQGPDQANALLLLDQRLPFQYGIENCDGVKAIEARRRVYENPPPPGRRRGPPAEGQYGIEDSAFVKMIAAKRRVEEVPPPRCRRRGRIKQPENGCCLAEETARARLTAERRAAIRLRTFSQWPTRSLRMCGLSTAVGITQTH